MGRVKEGTHEKTLKSYVIPKRKPAYSSFLEIEKEKEKVKEKIEKTPVEETLVSSKPGLSCSADRNFIEDESDKVSPKLATEVKNILKSIESSESGKGSNSEESRVKGADQ